MCIRIQVSILLLIVVLSDCALGTDPQDQYFVCAVSLAAMARANRSIIADGQVLAGFPRGRPDGAVPSLLAKAAPFSTSPIKVGVGNGEVFTGDGIKIVTAGKQHFGLVVGTFQDSDGGKHAIYLPTDDSSQFRILTDPATATAVRDQINQKAFEQSLEAANIDWERFGSFHNRSYNLGSVYGFLPRIPNLRISVATNSLGDGISVSSGDG